MAADWCVCSGDLDVLGLGSVLDGVVVVCRLGVCLGHGLVFLLLGCVDLDIEVVEQVLRGLELRCGLSACEQLEVLVLLNLKGDNVVNLQESNQVIRVGAQLLLPVGFLL